MWHYQINITMFTDLLSACAGRKMAVMIWTSAVLMGAIVTDAMSDSFWEEDSTYAGRQFSSPLFSFVSSSISLMTCGTHCMSIELCRGFTFVQTQGHCQGYGAFTNPSSLNDAQLWRSTQRDIMTGATCGAGHAHSSGTPDITLGVCEGTGCSRVEYEMTATGQCYFRSTTSLNWEAAAAECMASGGRLLMMESMTKVISFSSIPEGHVWIGLTYDMAMSGLYLWQWRDGSEATVTRWGPSQPVEINKWAEDAAMCVTLYNTEWYNDVCKRNRPYLCELV